MFDIFNETMYNFDVPKSIIWSAALEPLPTAFTQHYATNGGNSLGVTQEDGNGLSM